MVAKVIEAERPDALLPTLGGQTGLNVAMDLAKHGVLDKYGVEMIGANADVIDKAESRERSKGDGQDRPGGLPRQDGHYHRAAREWVKEIGLPAVVRPSFTMGGSGSAIAYNRQNSTIWCSRPRPLADHRGADRRVDHRLERVRDGGDARRGRQRRDHLLDRKLRSRWACTRATRLPWPLRRRSPTRSTSGCATPAWR